jgi:diaminopimelate epimerase
MTMKIPFHKYHALFNDFIVIDSTKHVFPKRGMSLLARKICSRKSGVGADGLLLLGKNTNNRMPIDVYNSDGSWAEKSGNGLRIAGLHLSLKFPKKRKFQIVMGGSTCEVEVLKKSGCDGLLRTDLGIPNFNSREIPIKTKSPYMINSPLKVGGLVFPVTCVSLGNPHTVLFVENFNFEWQTLGAEIENHKLFPSRTNVEFVKIVSPSRIKVSEWERGAGATGSSGTGAAAAVVAAVVLGFSNRKCKVEFESGALNINWRYTDNVIELTGPAKFICKGAFETK